MSARGLGGVAVGMLLVALTGCTAPAPDPLPTTTAPPLDQADTAPPALAREQLVRDVVADAQADWMERLAPRGVTAPVAEVVIVRAGEIRPATCAGEETDPVVLDDDAPTALACANGSATILVPIEPLIPLDDFAAAYLVSRAYAQLVADTAGWSGAPPLADCLVGVWTASLDARDRLDDGDVDDALELLDSAERREAFLQGFEGMPGLPPGDVDECVAAFSG